MYPEGRHDRTTYVRGQGQSILTIAVILSLCRVSASATGADSGVCRYSGGVIGSDITDVTGLTLGYKLREMDNVRHWGYR